MSTSVRVLPSPDAIGDDVTAQLLDRIEQARLTKARFLLGCPTGRTPRPVFGAMARRLAKTQQDISHLVLVMMDEYLVDARIADAGGIDFFILASGASDGHVAFNPPGSPRDSLTRIIPLSDETRRDNLVTFPAFGALSAVPRHGISMGIDTRRRR